MTGRARRLPLAIFALVLACATISAGLLPTPAEAVDGPEWQHALWIAGQLRAEPPTGPVALLLGGSCAREATVDDSSWAADVQRLGGDNVATYDLGSRRQTFEQDVALVRALPEIPMLIYIGINAGRFTGPLTETSDTTPPETKPTWVRHHYRSENIWTPERKQERVDYWLDHRLALFNERFADHATQLDRLIDECVRRGYTPVVLALPRNIVAMDHALDGPVDRYLTTGRRLAEKHGVAFVDFVPDVGLSNDDYFDLNHLVEPGRKVYQAWLAYETVHLLMGEQTAGQSGTTSSASPPAAAPKDGSQTAAQAGASALAASAGARALWPVGAVIVLLGVTLAALRRRAVVRRSRSRRRRRSGSRVHDGA